MLASFLWLACSSSSNAPPHEDAAVDARPDDGASDGDSGDAPPSGPYDPNGPFAACNDPVTQTATLLGDGFAQWEGLSVLGCFNASDPSTDTACNDANVTDGAFTILASVCNGKAWDLYVFDGTRGLNCSTTRAAVDRVFTLTPADCTCASANGDLLAGCAEDTDGGGDGDSAGPDSM